MNAQASKLQVLHFLVKKELMCINLQYVDKILPLLMPEQVPGSPSYFLGLINIAGKSIPVIDLAIRLELKRNTQYSMDIPIILCSNGQTQIGLLVDEILETSSLDKQALQMEDKLTQPNSPFIASLTYKNKKLSLLFNPDFLFNALKYTSSTN